MQPLQPHGAGKRLLSLLSDSASLDLVRYADGVLGIDRDGQSMGLWAASDEPECLRVFYLLGQFKIPGLCLVMGREAFKSALTATLGSRAILN